MTCTIEHSRKHERDEPLGTSERDLPRRLLEDVPKGEHPIYGADLLAFLVCAPVVVDGNFINRTPNLATFAVTSISNPNLMN